MDLVLMSIWREVRHGGFTWLDAEDLISRPLGIEREIRVEIVDG